MIQFHALKINIFNARFSDNKVQNNISYYVNNHCPAGDVELLPTSKYYNQDLIYYSKKFFYFNYNVNFTFFAKLSS